MYVVVFDTYDFGIFQTMKLENHQLEWLCQHLGHKMGIHKEHYRQMIGTVERVHVAKLLMLQDQNLTGKFLGKSLNDVDAAGR